METQIKILAIIYKLNNSIPEFLLLRNNSKDPKHGGDFWYVVTGAVEGDETLEQAVKREIFEETGIVNISQIDDTDGSFEYSDESTNYIEHIFKVQAAEDVKKLNEENVEFKWVDAGNFLKTVKWGEDFRVHVELITTAHSKL